MLYLVQLSIHKENLIRQQSYIVYIIPTANKLPLHAYNIIIVVLYFINAKCYFRFFILARRKLFVTANVR